MVNSIRDRTQSLVVRVTKWQTNSPEDNYPLFNLQKLPADEEDSDTETASPKPCRSQPDSSCGFTWSAHVVNSMSDLQHVKVQVRSNITWVWIIFRPDP